MSSVDPEAAASRAELSRTVLWALPFIAVLVAAAGLSAVLRAGASERFSVSAAFAVLASLALAGFVAVTRQRRPRAGILAACHALACVPLLAITASSLVRDAVVSGGTLHCSNGETGLLLFGGAIAWVVLLLGGIGAGIMLAKRETDRFVRSVALVATALALVAFAFAAVRVRRPDPDTYLASLVPAAVLQPGGRATVEGRELRYEQSFRKKVPSRSEGESGAPYDAERIDCTLTGYDEPQAFYALGGACPTLRVRVDLGHDFAVVDRRDGPHGSSYSNAFRSSTGASVTIAPQDVADHIAPPIGWTAGAGLGGFLGVGFLVAASRARRRAVAVVGHDGRHHGGGLVELLSGETVRVDAAAGLPPGDVILREPTEKHASYRQMGAISFSSASPGTLEALRATHTDLAASLCAAAFAASLLGATPLFVARIVAGL